MCFTAFAHHSRCLPTSDIRSPLWMPCMCLWRGVHRTGCVTLAEPHWLCGCPRLAPPWYGIPRRYVKRFFRKTIWRGSKKQPALPYAHNARVVGSRAQKNILGRGKKTSRNGIEGVFWDSIENANLHHTRLRGRVGEGRNAIIIRACAHTPG